MVSLLDIADIKVTANIRGKDVEVRGILAEHLALLLQRFPELKRIWVGKSEADTWQTLINQFPMVVGEIIAIGTGAEPGAKDYEKHVAVAMKLSIGEQFTLLQKIGEVTFPQGPKAFLEGVAAAVGLPPDALGWDQAMRSQLQSRDASQQDDPNENAGEAHPEHSQDGSTSSPAKKPDNTQPS